METVNRPDRLHTISSDRGHWGDRGDYMETRLKHFRSLIKHQNGAIVRKEIGRFVWLTKCRGCNAVSDQEWRICRFICCYRFNTPNIPTHVFVCVQSGDAFLRSLHKCITHAIPDRINLIGNCVQLPLCNKGKVTGNPVNILSLIVPPPC